MNYIALQNAKKYLHSYDEILNEMSKDMLTFRPKPNIGLYFTECMISHNVSGAKMCENLLKYTTFRSLQEMAQNIMQEQNKCINEMKKITSIAARFYNTKTEINTYLTKYIDITKIMIEKMQAASRTARINLNFVNEMIPHHEGTIDICNNLLQCRVDARIKNLTQDMVKDECNRVENLKMLRRRMMR